MADRLLAAFDEGVEATLSNILAVLRRGGPRTGLCRRHILNLLVHLNSPLRDFDFWADGLASLSQGMHVPDVNFAEAD